MGDWVLRESVTPLPVAMDELLQAREDDFAVDRVDAELREPARNHKLDF